MDIEIERLNVRLDSGISTSHASTIGRLVEAALKEILRAQAAKLSAARDSYLSSSLDVPGLKVRPGATDEEIARLVADALSRTILSELEMRP
jgi:hypothetical protein